MSEQKKFKELQMFINEVLDKLECLDQGVMFTPINHYDFYTILLIIKKIVEEDDETVDS